MAMNHRPINDAPIQTRRAVRFFALFVLAAALPLAGCATIEREPFEATQVDAAQPRDMPRVRYWADAPDESALFTDDRK